MSLPAASCLHSPAAPGRCVRGENPSHCTRPYMWGNGLGRARNGRTLTAAPSLAGLCPPQWASVADHVHAAQMRWFQTMNLPLFKIFFGSMTRFTARIMFTSVGVVPQTSKCGLASLGQCATSADDPAGNMLRNADTQLAYCMADGGSTESGTKAATRFPVAARPSTAGIKL